MPPFTFDPTELWEAIRRLANENDHSWRFTKKGDKRPAYDIEAGKAAKARNLKARQAAALERALARQAAAKPKPKPGGSIAMRMLRAMEPGKWYGQGDLVRLTGEDRSSRAKVHQVLVKQGWVEKGRNPAYSDQKLTPWEIMGGAEPQPEHLYRLTERGLAERRALLGRTGTGSDGTG